MLISKVALFSTITYLLVQDVSSMAPATKAWFRNFRSGVKYTTWNEMPELTTPGKEIFISPKDSFDFIPDVGYGQFEELVKKADEKSESWEAHVVLLGKEAATEWAQAQLKTKTTTLKKSEVLKPNENLVGMKLVVDSPGATELLPPLESVICHQFEEETFFCHKTKNVGVQTIEVSPHGKPSTLWLACHHVVEDSPQCHVMNVGDIFFSTAEDVEDSLYASSTTD